MVRAKHVIAWGRHDPEYARNRTLRLAWQDLGWTLSEFRPCLSPLADLEAFLRGLPKPDLIWVPGFRQRDLPAARRWSRRLQVPLLFDPLISAYAKQVLERHKFAASSVSAKRLLQQEKALFKSADLLLADTRSHAAFFAETFGIPLSRIAVVPLGAEEPLFSPSPQANRPDAPFEVLFLGSFIPLHGVETIAQAICAYQGPPVHWRFLGKGKERAHCENILAGRSDVSFDGWIPYVKVPEAIALSDLVLGVFGTTPQAERAISNKVFQALACGRPVLTRTSDAYPDDAEATSCLTQIPPGNPAALAQAVAELAKNRSQMPARNRAARALFDAHYSRTRISSALAAALNCLSPSP